MLSTTSVRRMNVPAPLVRLFQWYPRAAGERLGDLLAGHNVFISDIPRKFDTQHARHFSLVETLCVTPLFSLTIVHYFSTFFLYPRRRDIIPELMKELTRRVEVQQNWLDVISKKSPADAVAWRAGMAFLQIILFPLWMLTSAIAPQLLHAALEQTNHIQYQKYAFIEKESPPFVKECMKECQDAQMFHSQQITIPTDYVAAIVILLIVLYLTS